MAMKIFRLMSRLLIGVGLLAAAYLCGMYYTKYLVSQEENRSTVTAIAVVNMDTGILNGEEKKNYASELMIFPDTNFESAGLAEARKGLEDGRYAAYILIPQDFSQSIESINTEPVKACLTYEVGQNLRQDVQVKVANDIHNFILNLSNNVSYLYVDAILREVHSVQDSSLHILENDTADMQAVIGIQAEELMEEPEYASLQIGEKRIEDMDLAEDYQRAEELAENIQNTYEKNMEEAEKEFLIIKEGQKNLDSQTDETRKVLAEIDILAHTDGKCVYEDGMEHLKKTSGDYAVQMEEKKQEALQKLGVLEGETVPDPDEEIPMITRQDLISGLDSQIEAWKSAREKLKEFQKGEVSGNGVSGNSYAEDEEKKFPITEEEMEKAIERLEKQKENLDAYYRNAARSIQEIPDASNFSEETEKIIEEEIAGPVLEQMETEGKTVKQSVDTLQEAIDTYIGEVEDYDAISYLEEEKIDGYLSELSGLTGDMEQKIEEQDESYREYVDEAMENLENNTGLLQEGLDQAYEQTQENVSIAIGGLQKNRSSLNEQNALLLTGITEKLPYTRLGNLEYTQAYDFIVEPVLAENQSEKVKEISPDMVSLDRRDILGMILGITVLLIMDIVVQLIHRSLLQKKESREEGERWQAE